ncbi:unnamed protein product [Symbiodinium sp. CCMP2592]|nr:unnamed protein product [Symbiodinium sp. CCMP2592]
MLATVFGARRRARKAPPKAAKAPEVYAEPEKERRQRPRKRKRPSVSPAAAAKAEASASKLPPPAALPAATEPEPKQSKTSGAARRRLAKEKAKAEAAIQVPVENTEAAAGEALSQAALNAVQVSGPGCESEDLKPWLSFSEVQVGGPKGKLPQVVTSYMAQYRSFRQPTPIQAYCWPAACAGRNVLGISKTGSGKTLAFICPGLARILSFRSSPTASFGPYVLVIAPTRELAVQIAKDAKGLCLALRIRLACLFGGTSKGEQVKSLDKGVDLIVATPGRLDDLVSQPDRFTGREILSLSMVHYVVLDEADCMLELGFEHQVRRLLGKVNAKHQILCFSATWPPKVEVLAKERVKNAIRIEVGANQATGISGNSNCEQHVRCLRQSTAEAKTREQPAGTVLGKSVYEKVCKSGPVLAMLLIRAVSGEVLIDIDLLSFLETLPAEMSPVRALKQHLHSMLGLSRFRQRLVFPDDDAAPDDERQNLRPTGVQVVVIQNFFPASSERPSGYCQKRPDIRSGQYFTQVVHLLLDAKADKDNATHRGQPPSLIATQNGQLEANADKDKGNENGATPLYAASQNGHSEVARLLLEANVDQVARLLLEANVDKDKGIENGATPLHIAALNGQVEITRLLLEAQADMDKTTTTGASALQVAAHLVARLLLEAKTKENEAAPAFVVIHDGATPQPRRLDSRRLHTFCRELEADMDEGQWLG